MPLNYSIKYSRTDVSNCNVGDLQSGGNFLALLCIRFLLRFMYSGMKYISISQREGKHLTRHALMLRRTNWATAAPRAICTKKRTHENHFSKFWLHTYKYRKKKARDVDAESKLVQFYISEWSECTAPHRTHGILRRKTTKKRFFFGSAFESAALFQRRSCPCYYLQSWSIRPIFAGRCRRCVVWIAS